MMENIFHLCKGVDLFNVNHNFSDTILDVTKMSLWSHPIWDEISQINHNHILKNTSKSCMYYLKKAILSC